MKNKSLVIIPMVIIFVNVPCDEMFAIGKSYINKVLHEFVIVVNEVFRCQIQWPWEEEFFLSHGQLQGNFVWSPICSWCN